MAAGPSSAERALRFRSQRSIPRWPASRHHSKRPAGSKGEGCMQWCCQLRWAASRWAQRRHAAMRWAGCDRAWAAAQRGGPRRDGDRRPAAWLARLGSSAQHWRAPSGRTQRLPRPAGATRRAANKLAACAAGASWSPHPTRAAACSARGDERRRSGAGGGSLAARCCLAWPWHQRRRNRRWDNA